MNIYIFFLIAVHEIKVNAIPNVKSECRSELSGGRG